MACTSYVSVLISGASTRSCTRPEAGVNDSDGLGGSSDSRPKTPVVLVSGSHDADDRPASSAVRSRRVPRAVSDRYIHRGRGVAGACAGPESGPKQVAGIGAICACCAHGRAGALRGLDSRRCAWRCCRSQSQPRLVARRDPPYAAAVAAQGSAAAAAARGSQLCGRG
jgi:hypothetical protein